MIVAAKKHRSANDLGRGQNVDQTDGPGQSAVGPLASMENWRRIGELQNLGLEVSERTVSRLMPKRREAPSQRWRTFLGNHLGAIIAIVFFTVPTASFRVLFVMVVLAHHRRRIVHFTIGSVNKPQVMLGYN